MRTRSEKDGGQPGESEECFFFFFFSFFFFSPPPQECFLSEKGHLR